MRSTWLALALLVAGCFSESPNAGGCVEGDAACDCRPDGTCIADHECIASIDKCVPTGCTPGSESCTCVDGDCLSAFVCTEGVCVPPGSATTGGDPSVATSLSDTVVDTGPDPTIATTNPSDPSDPSGPTDSSNPTDATDSATTIPPDDTSATDVSASMSGDPSMTDASVSVSVSETDTSPAGCPECIELSGQDVCDNEYIDCDTDLGVDGCQAVKDCMLGARETPEACCEVGDLNADLYWNALHDCAQGTACADACDLVCNPK